MAFFKSVDVWTSRGTAVCCGLLLLSSIAVANELMDSLADVVYTNAKVYTVNDAQPWVNSVAIKDGKFLVVGDSSDVEAVIGEKTKIIDLNGAFIMPGIQENHVHISVAGTEIDAVSGRLQINTDMTPKQIQDAIVAYAKENPEGWIRGGQWGVSHFKFGRAHKEFLDEVMPDRPVVLINEDFHGAVANSKALELAGITSDSPQPSSGFIEKNKKTGEPTGFLADGGMFDVVSMTTPPTVEQWAEAILKTQEIVHKYGITSVTDSAANKGALSAFKALDDEGKLKLRVDFVIMMNDYMGDVVEPWKLLEERDNYNSRLINANKAKWGADGVPIASTSLMLEPYSNDPDSYGQMTATEEELSEISRAMGMGAQIMVHSVGDGTARKVLDAIAEARAKNPTNNLPVQLAHAVFVHPDDMVRMKELNVIAEMSPPMYFWGPVTAATIPALSKGRILNAQPIADFIGAGLLVSYGSDWPASAPSANPWPNLEAMITRLNPYGEFKEYGKLGKGIELETALKIFTLNGAKAMGIEEHTGTIEVGKYADMIILDANPFELVAQGQVGQISELNVTTTLFEGEVVYQKNNK